MHCGGRQVMVGGETKITRNQLSFMKNIIKIHFTSISRHQKKKKLHRKTANFRNQFAIVPQSVVC